MIEALVFGGVLGGWVMAVTTETGRTLTAWVAHFIGVLVMATLMAGSLLWSVRPLIFTIGN
jgi:hypothetical protein